MTKKSDKPAFDRAWGAIIIDDDQAISIDDDQTETVDEKALTALQARILEEMESRLLGADRLAAAVAALTEKRAKSYDEMNYIYAQSNRMWASIDWTAPYQVKPSNAKEPEAPLVPVRGKRKIVLE